MMAASKPQTKIMVVDDQDDITWSLSQALSDKEINASVITASTGKEALEKLSDDTINLLITDITMLDVDDQDLFLEIKKKFPAVYVIVMTAFPSANFKKEAVLGENLFFVEKPFDINKLKEQVARILAEKGSTDISTMPGISITDVIQLKNLAEATTTLRVDKSNQQGLIHFKDGEVIHAACDNQEGEDAFYKVLAFDKGIITTIPLQETIETTISRPCMTLIREGIDPTGGLVAKKEAARKKPEEEEAAWKKAEEEEAARKKAEEEEAARKKAEEEEAAGKEKRRTRTIQKELKNLISILSKAKGYIAAGVLAPSGKLLTHHTSDKSLDLNTVSAAHNDLFRKARATAKKIDFPPCNEMVFDYSEKAVLILCSGAEANIHFHLMAITKSCKQLEQVKVEMEKFQTLVRKELSAD